MSTGTGTSTTNAFAAMNSSGANVINYMMKLPNLPERRHKYGSERTIFEIGDLIREDLDQIPEIKKYSVTPGGNSGGIGAGSNIELKVFGYDFERTNEIANDLQSRLDQLDGTRDVTVYREDTPTEYNVKLERYRLAFSGLTSATVY